MKIDEFLTQIMERAGSGNTREAEKQARAVLAALTDGLSHKEAVDLSSQLPKGLKDYVTGRLTNRGPVQKLDRDSFLGRVQTSLGLGNREEAEHIARGVLSVLKEAIGWGEWDDVLSQISLDLQEMVLSA